MSIKQIRVTTTGQEIIEDVKPSVSLEMERLRIVHLANNDEVVYISLFFLDVDIDPLSNNGLLYAIHDYYRLFNVFPKRGLDIKCIITSDTYEITRVRYEPRQPKGSIGDAGLVFSIKKVIN